MLEYIIVIIIGALLIPGIIPLALSIPMWKRGMRARAAIVHSILYLLLVATAYLVSGRFIDGMDGGAPPITSLSEVGSLLLPLGVVTLLHLLPLVVSLPLWRKGRLSTALIVHWALYSFLLLLVTCTPIFGVIHW